MRDSSSEKSVQNLLFQDTYDYRFDIGITKPVKHMQFLERHALISCIAKHFAIHQVKAELDQILSGLSETLNVLALIRENPVLFRPLFIFSERVVTGDYIYDLFSTINGSNVREEEEAATMYWIELLREIHSESEKI